MGPEFSTHLGTLILTAILSEIFSRRFCVHIFGLGAVVLGLTGLVWGTHSVFSYAVALVALLAGLAMQWRRSVFLGALAFLVAYCVTVICFHVLRGLANPFVYVAWYGVFENLALAAAALIICLYDTRLKPATIERLSKIARVIFGICPIYYGVSHYLYLANTVSMVPAWLPPGQTFWAYATGVAQIAAGIAIIVGVCARPAAMLLAAMYIVFAILVHAPRIIMYSHMAMSWGENAINFALTGAAWVIAASIPLEKSKVLQEQARE
jgi:uncharacterized membrane protein YphA (DoxX/SURF4 family)